MFNLHYGKNISNIDMKGRTFEICSKIGHVNLRPLFFPLLTYNCRVIKTAKNRKQRVEL